jgi:gamma-glutamylcyclotransferase (GGCT)/AIG2-like uncharacterized protein YtfP
MKYFAYGMNTNLEQMRSRCPTAVCLGPAWINNYEFKFRTHADVEKSPGSICYGVLWELTDQDLRALDALEGYPYYYTRFKVRAHTGDQTVKALVYQMNDQSYIQEPGSGYLEMVTEGYQENGVPTDQIDRAINMVCSSSTATNLEWYNTWSPTTRDYV